MAWARRDAWVTASLAIGVILGACPAGDDGDTGADAGTDSGVAACEMLCGETPCHPPEDCFGEAFCVPPADEACVACMMANCADSVGATCGEFDCIDYAKTIGGCGDAVPYAEGHYECMAMSCDAECAPGEGFTACACI